MSEPLERALEARLKRVAEHRGGLCLKLHPAAGVGVPDRLVLMPGAAFFVEVKAANGRVSRGQAAMHDRLRDLGFEVLVMRGERGLRQLLEERL